jgi:hypothetical protein
VVSVFGPFDLRPNSLAWEIHDHGGPLIVDKPGGLHNSSTYIGMVPERKLGCSLPAWPRATRRRNWVGRGN